MRLRTNLVLIGLINLFLRLVASAQEIVPQPMPESVVTHICGDDFQPSDLTFDRQGVLYAIEAQRTNKPLEIYNLSNTTCIPVPLNFEPESSAIATDSEGNICVPYLEVGRGPDGKLACWNGRRWKHSNILDHFAFSFSLSFSSETMWLAHSRFFDYASVGLESGGISFFRNGKYVATWMRPTDTISRQPNFVVATTNKAIFTENNYKQESISSVAHLNGSVVEIDTNGETKVLNDDFDVPTGIALVNDFIVVADYARGELYQLDLNGNTKAVYTGLQGPMGIAQAPNGDLCIAEMLGGRISCYSLASLGLE
jgi:hypothetical protein